MAHLGLKVKVKMSNSISNWFLFECTAMSTKYSSERFWIEPSKVSEECTYEVPENMLEKALSEICCYS